MFCNRSRLLCVLAVTLSASLGAQVPWGHALMSNVNNAAPMEGLLLVDRAGNATPITGLLSSGFPSRNVPVARIDPWDGRIWLGGPAFTTTRVHRAEIVGTTIVNPTQMAVINVVSGTQALALDLNGNAIVSSDNGMVPFGGPNAGAGLFRVDRHTGAVTRLIGGTFNWPFGHYGGINEVVTDDSGNLWFAVTNDGSIPGRIYRLAPGANGDYATTPTLVFAVPSPASAGNVSSIDWVPARGSRPERLWFAAGGVTGPYVGYYENGTVQFVSGVGVHAAIEHDAIADDFWLLAADPDEVRRMDHAGNVSIVAQVPPNGVNGTPTSIDVHDGVSARTLLVPQFVPAAGSFDLEICTTCPPGHLGVVVMVAPASGTFVLGTAGVDGRIRTRLQGLSFARGFPGAITVLSACLDPATATLQIGEPLLWPRN